MKKSMSKLLALTLLFCMLTSSALAADTLEVASTYTDTVLETYRSIVDAFTAETGIEVDLVTPGSEYETVMKTRMASGDLPDVWETHGWAVKRYSEYLMPLNNEVWVPRMDPAAAAIVTGPDGNIYGACINQSMGGCIYNIDVLNEAGVDPASIRSLQDFYDACEKVKAIGKVPVYIGGKDSGNAAGFFSAIASAMLTATGSKYDQGAALQDGTFDWDTYGTEVMKEVAFMVNSGYINVDFTTADTVTQCTAIGAGECGFLWRHAQNITWAREYVPGANIGFMPYPSYTGVVMGYIMYFFLSYNRGILNDIIGMFGIAPIDWLASPFYAVLFVTLVNSWQYVGNSMVMYLAGLQNIPSSYYEAAAVDGASVVQRFFRLTLPLLIPSIQTSVITNLIGSLKLYGVIIALTNGGPGHSSQSLTTYITNRYFSAEKAGYAAAIGIFTFLFIMLISTVLNHYFSKKEVEY